MPYLSEVLNIMEQQAFAVQRVRKVLWYGIPLLLSMVALSWWIFFGIFVPSLQEVVASAPSVEIWPGGIVAPFSGLMFLGCTALVIMRAIPCSEIWSRRVDTGLLYLTVVQMVVIVVMAVSSSFVQGYFLPKLGYTKCTLLQGNPTMWFTHWVKNPEWCVRGKDRAWVHEQAGAPPPKF